MSDRPPAQRFPYIAIDQTLSQASLLPYLPLKLIYGEQSLAVQGMLDTGATVNVLPYDVGLQLGAIWDNQTVRLSSRATWLILRQKRWL